MLIAFAGNGRHAGKDTAADFAMLWAKEHGIPARKVAFATVMKTMVANALGFQTINMNGEADPILDVDLFKENGKVFVRDHAKAYLREISGRDFIINLAESARDLIGTDFWTNIALPTEPARDQLTVISDLRFNEEAERVRQFDGMVVYIDRWEAEKGASEGMLDRHYRGTTISNNSSLDYLNTSVRSICYQEWMERERS